MNEFCIVPRPVYWMQDDVVTGVGNNVEVSFDKGAVASPVRSAAVAIGKGVLSYSEPLWGDPSGKAISFPPWCVVAVRI